MVSCIDELSAGVALPLTGRSFAVVFVVQVVAVFAATFTISQPLQILLDRSLFAGRKTCQKIMDPIDGHSLLIG